MSQFVDGHNAQDRDWEEAIEELERVVESAAVARILTKIAPLIECAYKAGFRDGRQFQNATGPVAGAL
jgi:hypothetical protein